MTRQDIVGVEGAMESSSSSSSSASARQAYSSPAHADTNVDSSYARKGNDEMHHQQPKGRRRQRQMASTTTPAPAPSKQCFTPTSNTHNPSSHDYYDKIYTHLKSTSYQTSTRLKSVEIVPPQTFPHTTTDQEIALVHIMGLTGFSARKRSEGNISLLPRGANGVQSYGDSNGLILAIHHFNNGIGDVVSSVDGINNTCPIRLVNTNFDSESSQAVAVNVFSSTIVQDPNRITSVLFGAWRSAVSIPLATLSNVHGVPQFSPLSTSTELDDFTQYPTFSRLIPSDAGTARATVAYLRKRIDTNFLGVLYVNDAYGSAFNQAIQESALDREENDRITVKGYPFSYNSNVVLDTREIELAVQQLKETGIRIFFGVFYSEHYELIMNLAYEYGIVGPDYLWIISDGLSESYFLDRKYEAGSPLAIASQGIGILKAEGGRETPDGSSGFDRFVGAYFDQDADAVGYTNCKQPANNSLNDLSVYYQAEPDFFQSRSLYPTAGGAFAYDTAIAVGLAACKLYEKKGSEYFDGTELFDAFVNVEFEGATGQVKVDPETTSRSANGAFFVLYNSNGVLDENGEFVSFDVQTVSHTTSNPDKASSDVLWVDVPGMAYRYADGSTKPPQPIPPQTNKNLNQIGSGMRGAAYALMGLIFLGSIGYVLWTYWNRNARIVRASQPMFLYMLCAGTFIMGSTIIPMSIDDGVASKAGCDIACMASPWLMTYGFVIAFSALFSKTWRINKIFHHPSMRRVKVTAKDVIIPFVALLGLNTVVLIVWTVVSPLKWERTFKEVKDDFGRPVQSFGRCTVENDKYVPYVVLLFIINLAVLLLANIQAYQARAITTEYSESKYIGIINASILQASIIGVPLLVIVSDEPSAFFFVRVGLVFVICMSILTLIFIPKMKHLKQWRQEIARKKALKEERMKARKQALKKVSSKHLERPKPASPINERSNSKHGITIDVLPKIARKVSQLEVEDDPCADNSEGQTNSLDTPVISDDEIKRCYEKILSEDKIGGDDKPLDVDEELAIVDAAVTVRRQESRARLGVDNPPKAMASVPQEMISSVSRQLLRNSSNSQLDSSYGDDESFDDSSSVVSMASSHNGASGIKILQHPMAEGSEVRRLRAQVEYMKLEKLQTSDKMRALRLALSKKGIDMDGLLESLDEDSFSDRASGKSHRSQSMYLGHSLDTAAATAGPILKAFNHVKKFVGTAEPPERTEEEAGRKVRFMQGFRGSLRKNSSTPSNICVDRFSDQKSSFSEMQSDTLDRPNSMEGAQTTEQPLQRESDGT